MGSFIRLHEVTVSLPVPAVGNAAATTKDQTYVFYTTPSYDGRTTELGISESGQDAQEVPVTSVKELLRVGALDRITVAYKEGGATSTNPEKRITLLIAKGKEKSALKNKAIKIKKQDNTVKEGTITRVINKRDRKLV